MKVLIAEDEESLLTLYEIFLKNTEFQIIGKAKNGQEAIDMFRELSEKPDIIIMDYRMPIKNGIQATEEILQINNNIKIIFASADVSVKQLAISAGAWLFISKPFSFEDLLIYMRQIMKEKLDPLIT